MRWSRILIVLAVIVILVVSFHSVSARVLHWIIAMHGGGHGR
jgi:hypothetical protein